MNFRNVFIALACMALFVGLAGAQQQTLSPVSCTVSAASSPTIRSESLTDKVGDVVITCGTSSTIATSGPVTRGNLLIDFGTPVTSKRANSVNNVGAASEVLLLINDPQGAAGNGPVPGYGQNAPITTCAAADLQGDVVKEVAAGSLGTSANSLALTCPANLVAKTNTAGTQTFWELDNGGVSAANALQGAIGGNVGNVSNLTGVSWSSNQVMFFNVPIFPSYNASQSNVFRIVNARVNPGANATITATLTPSTLSTNSGYLTGSTYNYAMTGTPQVASVASGLTTSISGPVTVSLCTPSSLTPGANTTKANLAIATFKENFTGAFKTAYLPLNNAAGDAMGGVTSQFNPSGNYIVSVSGTNVSLSDAFSEAGFTAAGTLGGVSTGTANTGTRLKAVFTSLDKNTTYYVSINPVVDFQTNPAALANPGDATSAGYARLLATQGSAGETAAYAVATQAGLGNNVVPVAQLTVASDGTAEAVWEITNTVEGTPQTLNFAIYAVYNTNLGTTPTAGNLATIQLGYAPTNGSSSTTPKGVTTSNVPRFAAPSMAATKFHNILPCQTSLLFPYVLGSSGYATGLAVSNTSADPYLTTNSSGACKLDFYSSGTTSVSYTTPSSVAPGTTWAGFLTNNNTLYADNTSTTLTGFTGTGYMFATCNFQYAHGFAFIDKGDGTSSAMAMGYLAPVVNSSSRGLALTGESLGF